MKRTRAFFTIAGFTLLVVIIVFFSTRESDEIESEPLEIGYSRLRISLPVFVAEKAGIFEENGLDVELLMYETAQPLMQALVSGQIEVGGYTAFPITYNGMLRSQKSLLFLTMMVEDQKHRISYLLKPADSPISSVSELKGKTIGILPTIAYSAWLKEILKSSGIDPDKDVVIQQVAPTLQPQALSSGGVDALFTNDPAATTAIQLGVAELVSPIVELPELVEDPFPFGSFNVSRAWADSNPEKLTALKASLDQAIDYINQNPELAKEYMKSFLPDTFKPHVQHYPDARYLKTAEVTSDMLNSISESYLKMGIIQNSLTFDDSSIK